MSKRAAIYARVSTDKQRNNESVPSQIDACLKRIEEKGYTLVGDKYVNISDGKDAIKNEGAVAAYVDDYSGTEMHRPNLNELILFLENVGFDVLVVQHLDRLARDPFIRETLEMEVKSRNAKVEYVLGDYSETIEGEMHKDFDSLISKAENKRRTERMMRGKKSKAKKGAFMGGKTSYGYALDKDAPCGLVVIEEQAEIVRLVFHLYVIEHLSIRAIADKLTEDKVPTYYGKTKWGKSSVSKILRNEAYIGKAYYNKHEYKKNRITGKHEPIKKRHQEEWIPTPSPVIVDENLFNQAQKMLDRNKEIRRKQTNRFYLLSGMVICEHCGRVYYAQGKPANIKKRTINDQRSYRHRSSFGHCLNKQISANTLEPLVWDVVKDALLNPDNLVQGYKQAQADFEKKHEKQRTHLSNLVNKKAKLKQQQQNLTNAYIDPDLPMSKSEYIEQKIKVDDNLQSVTEEIETIERELKEIATPVEIDDIFQFSNSIRDFLESDEPTNEEMRHILELINANVIIDKEGNIRLDGLISLDSDVIKSTEEVAYGQHYTRKVIPINLTVYQIAA